VKIFSDHFVSKVHPDASLTLKSAFVVFYRAGDEHVMHNDHSDLTINICLGKEGFCGGNLLIERSNQKIEEIEHKIGHAIIHAGRERHGAEKLLYGKRMNLILWMDCPPKFHRFQDLFEELQMEIISYVTIPDIVNLSITSKRYANLLDNEILWKMYKNRFNIQTMNSMRQFNVEDFKDKIIDTLTQKCYLHDIAGTLTKGHTKYAVEETIGFYNKNEYLKKGQTLYINLKNDPDTYLRVRSTVISTKYRVQTHPLFFLPSENY